MKDKAIDAMVLELIGAVDYDAAKNFDPACAEEPEEIPRQMAELRRIVQRHLKKAKLT